MRLRDKVAIVSGGGGMIGSAIARRFASEGASVVVADLNTAAAQQVVEAIEDAGGSALSVPTDVSVRAETERLAQATAARFGGVDVLVSCAYWQEMGDAVELSDEGWQRSLDTSLKGTWLCARAVIPHMLDRGGGAIVTLSSIQAVMPYPHRAAYTAVKGGISALTRGLAVDWGPRGIRANAILPGRIVRKEEWDRAAPDDDPRLRGACYPVNRVGFPEDIAAAALFLASDEAAFVNGIDLLVDGGISIQSSEAMVSPALRRGWRPGIYVPAEISK